MEISVIGIGTELTTGQIVNRNAQWISAKLKELGVLTAYHIAVPDHKDLILKSFNFAARDSNILFVTGGLGPTSDDFTRDVVSQWTGKRLQYDDKSWQHIENRLLSRGLPVKEIQRQQCYFPEGSTIFYNREGTANGFALIHNQLKIYVLPGPPREIAAIWNDYIHKELTELTKSIDTVITKSWDTIGTGESSIAELTEEAIQGSGLEVGYRVHLPYVEVKLSFKKSQLQKMDPFIRKLDQVLSPFTALRDGQDAAQLLLSKLKKYKSVTVVDQCSQGFLHRRLNAPGINFLYENFNVTSELILSLKTTGDFTAMASLNSQSESFTAPIKKESMKERARQFFAEKAILFWLQQI